MLSPTPLFCTLLLCLPLAIVITNTITIINTTPTATIRNRRSLESPVTVLLQKTQSTTHHRQKLIIQTIISLASKKPPSPPPPPQDDQSLLRSASRVNPRPLLPKKIAFLFLTTTPLHFAPLWELYFDHTPKQLFNIYIHADPSHDYDPPFSGVFFNRVIPSQPSQRYSPTLISAARRLLAHALLHDPANAMKSFIEILKNEEWMYERWAARGPDAMLPEVKLEEFRIGSQFWVLTRKHARLVVNEQRIWAKFNRTCVVRHSCYPEENYFPTLIHMKDPRGTVSASLTHVNWTGRYDGHPRMYEASEVGPELITTIRRSRPRYGYDGINGSDLPVTRQNDPLLFARKFSPESIEPLLNLAKEIILKD
ncbi:glycosyltransferase BC10 [Ricinus communis]|uniref:glycosyltransferase BC10 n=1 Tax=Ricinus communis TaxID=3988 RepID=UPI00201ACECB|nr:glycosyltransferase BC10 [Ricinus communis]